MSYKLKSLTESSWLVINDTEESNIGLLTKLREEYVLMIKGHKEKFQNKSLLTSYFKEDIFNNVVATEPIATVPTSHYINGYPVDFDNPHEVLSVEAKYPLFSKKATSDVYYCAGYYCVNFPKNWMGGLCPKLSTLEKYETAGPFKTELEMKLELQKLRKIKNSSVK